MNEKDNIIPEPEGNEIPETDPISETDDKLVNESPDKDIPAEDVPTEESHEDEIPAEDTKAFKWDYTESDGEQGTIEEPQEAPSSENEPAPIEDSVAETEFSTESKAAENPDDKNPEPKHKRKFTALHLSCILSACSILLLLAFSFTLMTGLFPISSINTNLGTNSTPTSPETEADPSTIEDFLNSVVIVIGNTETSTSTGTGVIISTDGYIITNYHVIEDCDTITVELYGENTAEKAEVIGYHENDDVAVLKISRTGLRAATFVDSNAVRYGEKVYAIGTPEGSDYGWSVTQGIVSCPDRQLMIYDDEGILEKKMNVVQTDASVNHGNSGGPIINVRGEVVGIVTLKRSDSAGMGFALPSNGVLIDAQAIIKNGHADNVSSGISMPRPLLGITGVGVVGGNYYESFSNEEGSGVTIVDEEYSLKNPSTTFYAAITGVYVSAVSTGSDAAKHLKSGDIVTEINGTPVATIYQVMNIINKYNGGDTVTIKYYRHGRTYTVAVALRSATE